MRSYIAEAASVLLIALGLTGVLNIIGLSVGIVVGVLTAIKAHHDIKIKKKENRIKELELIKKENED